MHQERQSEYILGLRSKITFVCVVYELTWLMGFNQSDNILYRKIRTIFLCPHRDKSQKATDLIKSLSILYLHFKYTFQEN